MIENERSIIKIFSSLAEGGYSVRFRAFSAIDMYMGLPSLPCLWIETNADIAVLARFNENLRFPGVEIADGAVDTPSGVCYFLCLDNDERKKYTFPLLSFAYDWRRRRFQDPLDLYPLLKAIRDKKEIPTEKDSAHLRKNDFYPNDNQIIMDAALLKARYGISAELLHIPENPAGYHPTFPGPESQRILLSCLLVSPHPELGLEYLKRSGFLAEIWPELAAFDSVDHSKEYHPEGNVWNHTLETFQHRKAPSSSAFDLGLSLGLLLHDMGKPISASFGSRRFDGHAELGAKAAARFLERLEFDSSVVRDVFFLVKNHMLPAALKRLPLKKTEEIMTSPLFPALMELYRCDESSSFKGLDSYYENSAAYRTYLKNIKNPYRSAARMFVEK